MKKRLALMSDESMAGKLWRQTNAPKFKKMDHAGTMFMKWQFRPGRKARLRCNKWARLYEHYLNAIPMPPE